MNENLDFKTYFETPIYVVELPELIIDLNKASDSLIKEAKNRNKKFIKERNKKFKKDIGDFSLSHHSTSLLNLPKFKKLQDYVLAWTEYWVQEFAEKGGGHHEGHIHYDNHISGFYFLKTSHRTSFPVFHDPRIGKIATQLPLKKEDEITFGSQQINYRPKPGTLILFPAFMEHQFTVDCGLDPFRFIHFNIQAIRKNGI
jgi:hypothetical protein